ncbi:MAG TPA: ATP-binding cassette domain-containing protein [Candidatus Alectryocaccomicrobium excrementavium]|uniref:ATP-binding cassette domain-containing protein n=1 Tax=Candidatus Alectryocaccomicrobium excrementavium TaxID=2840668 RepID=A0A9D1G2I3_9FIRM|nr:ATP-binding cassette domain-containing protein [Candidatus Alectryocaccomicrobium excrementavium]
MIVIEDAYKTFESGARKVDAVRGVSLTIQDGEIFGVIGYSGAGKSTLIRLINLLERPTSGKIFVNGQELTALAPKELRQARRKIGMIFQHFNLMKSRTVYSNVAYPLRGSSLSKEERRNKVMNLLKLVGLEEKALAYPAQLSGGQKQRVAIARALANDPTVLLCDEATSALDPQTTQDILRLLRDVNRKLGITIVLITHEIAVVKEICTRLAVMDAGRVVEEGAIYDVFSQPKAELTQRFIRTTNNLARFEELLANAPDSLNLMPGDVIAQMEFHGGSAGHALVSTLSREYGVDISIVFGNIDILQATPLGTLIVIFRGPVDQVQKALLAAEKSEVQVEVLRRV